MIYLELAKVYGQLENTTKRLEKTSIISKLLEKTPTEEINETVLLLQGRIFPPWDYESKIGVAARLVLKAINIATGSSVEDIEKEWKETGDLGTAAEKLITKKQQATLFSSDLEVSKVFSNLRALAKAEGSGAVDRKIKLIAELLTSAKPLEARYITRTVLEDLRVGVGEGSIRDAIVWAYFKDRLNISYNKEDNKLEISEQEREEYNNYIEAVQEAVDITNDFSEVAETAKEQGLEGLKNITLKTGKPIKVMLYQKAENMEDAFERVGKPAALEFKYDGFRLQIHKDKEKINLFTRRLENVTAQFPDVVDLLKENIDAKACIFDAEIIGIDPKTGKWLPFQNISHRIKRKYDIHQTARDIPVMVNIFDAVQVNKKSLLKEPFSKRRQEIKNIIKEVPQKIQLAEQIITDNIEKAEEFYQKSLDIGNEGIMAKSLDKPYKPGSRVGYGVKVKPVMETLDLVITAAEWGEGKRASWLSSFTIACRDQEGNFLDIGKVGTGIKEKEKLGVSFSQLTEMLTPLITKEQGREVKVKPQIVVEINYEEIQKSPTYSSGYALRFPRLVRLRQDRSPDEISTLETVEEFYKVQRNR